MNVSARRAFVATVVAVAVVAAALALWKLRVLVALLFLALIVAAAMRPGVEALARRRIPRVVGIGLHYLALLGLIVLFLWFVVPQALHQIEAAVANAPQSSSELRTAARHSSGVKRRFLLGLAKELHQLPPATSLIHPALELTRKALEILVGIFFVFASAAYWIFERERLQALMLQVLPKRKRRVAYDTWNLVDLKLGAYVRGQFVLITFVSSVLSFAFWQIGLPYWLLLGIFAGIVEIVPVIGPLAAGAAAIGVGFTVSWQTAGLAALAVYGLRLLQDYVLGPRVLGHAVGLAPLIVLVAVSAVGLLLGPALVPLATPFAAVLATVLDVLVRGRDPAAQKVPRVLFPGHGAQPAKR